MSIPSQFPLLALAIRSSALQALVLQPGQILEGKVLGTMPNGTSQVQIGKQTFNLSLPMAIAAGTTLSLQAQGSGKQQTLVLVQPPARADVPAPSGNAAALAQTSARPAAPASATPLSIRPEALRQLALQPGQAVEARVLGPAANGATQLQIGRQTVEVALPRPLSAGTVLPLQVQGSGTQQRLVMQLPAQGNASQPSTAPGPVPSAPAGPTTAPQLPQATGAVPPQSSATATAQPSAGSASPIAAPPSGAVSTPLPAPPPSPPQAALTQMVQAAVQRQDSVANLTTVLAAVVGKVPLPQPVLQAAQQVLAASLPLTGPSLNGPALQKAVAASGIFQEAALAQGVPLLAQGDLKTTLLTLRNSLVAWLGQTALTAIPPGPMPPPVRGAFPRARPVNTAPIEIPETSAETGKVLLERTEGSLARLRLHQSASLPEPAAGTRADWSMDIPVLIGSYHTVMQLQIHRDEAGPEQAASERGWQVRFAMDVPKLGEVGAQVGLRGGTTSVRLWATDAATAAQFEAAVPELTQSLLAAGLQPGIVIVRAGDPPPNPPATGHFVDALT